MSLFDQLVGLATQAVSQGQLSGLTTQVVNMLGDQRSGGIDGLTQRFQQHGLGDLISSWVGTGANQPITVEQLTNAIGTDRINALAGKVGLSPDQASAALTQVLPTLIDRLTPDGKIPPPADVLQAGLNLLKKRG